ncbi:(Fe-S)-binding protein [Candidatus Neomarinimicrobiota bacterium]
MVAPDPFLSRDDYRLLQECIHCGYCLPVCPTYIIAGREADSPRGRLLLMKYLDQDTGTVMNDAYRHIDLCLGCLACQTVCPSGVRYGHLLEQTRGYQRNEVEPLSRFQRKALDWITGHTSLKIFSLLLRIMQRTGLDKLVRILHLLPGRLRFQLAGVPKIPAGRFDSEAGRLTSRSPDNSQHGAVALFTGCIMDHWYSEVHDAAARILRWNGFDVLVPQEQGCCGALHAHAGALEKTEMLLTHNREVFRGVEAEALIVDAAGCSAQLRTGLWPENGGMPVKDVCEWLIDHLQHPPRFKLTSKTTYDAPCHLFHAQGIQEEPYRLLEYACEQLHPLPEADTCCGSAGIYSLVHSEMSREILARKLQHVRTLEPEILATANPGCQMQLQGGVIEAGMNIKVRHVVQLLDQAYRLDSEYRQVFDLK